MSENQSQDAPDAAVVAGVTDGTYALLVADFADPESAWSAYEDLKSIEDGRTVAIEGVVVVKRAKGGRLEVLKATDHSARSGLRMGSGRRHRPRGHLPALDPGERSRPWLGRRGRRQDPPAAPSRRPGQGPGGLDRTRPLGHRGPRLRPQGGEDPRGARPGRRHRGAYGRQGGSRGDQGCRQGRGRARKGGQAHQLRGVVRCPTRPGKHRAPDRISAGQGLGDTGVSNGT